jgi:uncharacterized protein (DUF4415 family)
MSEQRIVKKSLEEIKHDLADGKDQTDWDRVGKLTDEEIKQIVREDPDAVLVDEDWFRTAELVVPSVEKKRISIRLDEDVLSYFKQQGRGYQTRINDVLKAYVLTRRLKKQREALEPDSNSS